MAVRKRGSPIWTVTAGNSRSARRSYSHVAPRRPLQTSPDTPFNAQECRIRLSLEIETRKPQETVAETVVLTVPIKRTTSDFNGVDRTPLPPGLILSAILGGGWTYNGNEYRVTPDIYASVNLGHLQQLRTAGLMSNYEIYMHNELQIMVAKGNPKRISGIDDLVRNDVRTSMPNPINEGIMQFYARKILERHGIWPAVANGQECASCQTTERNWFTAVHHRETPDRIRDNKSDAGIVWKTEVMEALRQGAQVEALELPAVDSLRDEVSYAIGALENSRHRGNVDAYLAFLATAAAQDAYARFGFVKARPDELVLRPID